ncbi:aldo/keto reductase [Oceanicoccus sp. KOV_DT_Chl]|uniref:aldo/keto reductase n=1 Tax=Oceanicoccus sp. KOV_DT_Chl TaxID=1904639 RepID=UPI000C7E3C57|nr:aldo/keto reductase [Oceanicoccus sp. KOV_DT_Chl]
MTIDYRKLGPQQVNPIGLGCMSLSFIYGQQPTPKDSAALLHRALDPGYNHLDTARLYDQGHSEDMRSNIEREEFS